MKLCRVCVTPCEGNYCSKHVSNNPRTKKQVDWWYVKPPWPKFSIFLRVRNAQCQRINKGVRCMKPSELVHHLISPRVNLSLLLDPANCVCLCRGCHPSEEGTPGWMLGADYVATVS